MAANLGTDLGDFAAVETLVTGRELLALDISWRFQTPEGSLFTDPGYGYDLAQHLSDTMGAHELPAIAARCELECTKDDRVRAARCTLTLEDLDGTKRLLRLVTDLTDADGTFRFIISVTSDGFNLSTLEAKP